MKSAATATPQLNTTRTFSIPTSDNNMTPSPPPPTLRYNWTRKTGDSIIFCCFGFGLVRFGSGSGHCHWSFFYFSASGACICVCLSVSLSAYFSLLFCSSKRYPSVFLLYHQNRRFCFPPVCMPYSRKRRCSACVFNRGYYQRHGFQWLDITQAGRWEYSALTWGQLCL